MDALLNHLWQSTTFAVIVAIAAAILRRHSPRLRYWLWLAASAKFLVPFSLILVTGAHIQLPPDTPGLRATTVQHVSMAFAPVSIIAPARAGFPWTTALTAVWFAGAAFFAFRWFRCWRQIHRAARHATKLPLQNTLPAYSSAAMLEPGVFGIFRPVLLLPEDLDRHLSPAQFEAVLAHESRHIRYRDNLTAAFHMLVETLFWFHPLVWWIGARLVEERERDCDEAALRQGGHPGDYARGIVSVCQSYVESPLPCASGISGADLKKRICEILSWRASLPITRGGKAVLAAAAIAAISLPFAIGILRAQSLPTPPQYLYDTVSVHRSAPDAVGGHIGPGPQGGLKTENTTLMLLVTFAYNVRDYQIERAPGWVNSQRYDVTFTPDRSETTPSPGMPLKQMQGFMERNRQRLQAVLRDRFGLLLRTEMHELPVYALTVAKSGSKMTTHTEGPPSMQMGGRGDLRASGVTMQMLMMPLSQELGRPVSDETGLNGQYDFRLTWTPDVQATPNA
ncbi:MAG TPA: M56 family metallopeptidase, partial [Bryobacteraceae bacterium]